MQEGQKVENFCLKNAEEKEVCLKDYDNKWKVIYFYPKDNTPGCTVEAIDFSELKEEFEKNNTIIFGISKDTCKSHQNFIDKKGLTITLLSDPEVEVHKQMGVWQLKKFMGKEYIGTVRTTFILDPHRKIVKKWENVKVKGHAQEVLEEIKKLQNF